MGKSCTLDATTTASTSTTPAAPGGSHVSITHNHHLGDHSDDIRALQQFLGFRVASSGAGSPGSETTRFGALTYQALVKFQKAQGLPPTGYLGPLSAAITATQ